MSLASLPKVVFIGASSGGVNALLTIAAGLPPRFAAAVLIVQHIGAHHSVLPEILSSHGPNPAKFGANGDVPQPGTIYVAPSDHHMLIDDGKIRVRRGPKEQHARPAINPLFRSAALTYGTRSVGVILTGRLDDGTAGLKAIKDCGGVTVVQDPAEALESSMPSSALANVEVDFVATLREMPDLLAALAQPTDAAFVEPPAALRVEHAVSLGEQKLEHLRTIGTPSAFTCPDCGGALFELDDKRPVRFLCHTGHSYSLRSLALAHDEATETAIWAGVRALQEKEAILRRLAEVQATERPGSESSALAEAEELADVVSTLRRFAEQVPSNKSFG